MTKTILITGGSGSGKSRWATTSFAAYDNVLYIYPGDVMDNDTRQRIEYENRKNYVEWDIKTGIDQNPESLFAGHKFAIFDGLVAYTAKVMDRMWPGTDAPEEAVCKTIERSIIEDVQKMYEEIDKVGGIMIVITVETGFSLVPTDERTKAFRHILGTVNQRIANISSEVYLSASGIQFRIK